MSSATTDFDRRDLAAAVLGTVAGVVLGGGGIQVGVGPAGLDQVGTLVGVPGTLVAWTGALVVSLCGTVAFGPFLGYATDPFVAKLFSVTRRNDRIRSMLLPVVTNHAYVATALSLGFAYGVGLGVLVGGGLVPGLLLVAGADVSVPAVVLGVVAWTAYGVAVGGVYALLTDRS